MLFSEVTAAPPSLRGCKGVSSEVLITETMEQLSEQLWRHPGDLRCWTSPDLQGPRCPRHNLVLVPR